MGANTDSSIVWPHAMNVLFRVLNFSRFFVQISAALCFCDRTESAGTMVPLAYGGAMIAALS